MVPEERRPTTVMPYLPHTNEPITGEAKPFDLCYLFTLNNRDSRPLANTLESYTELIADAIALNLLLGRRR